MTAEEAERPWLAWSDGRYPEDTPGDVIAAWPDGTIMLDDSLTIWNPKRALAFVAAGGVLQGAAKPEKASGAPKTAFDSSAWLDLLAVGWEAEATLLEG